LTYTHHNDHTSRPRHSTNRPINLHTLNIRNHPHSPHPFPSPPRIIIRFRHIPLLSACSSALSPCFRVCFSYALLLRVYFCLPPLPVSSDAPSGPGSHPVIKRPSTSHPVPRFLFHHFFRSIRTRISPSKSDRLVLQNPGNPKQYTAWATTETCFLLF